MKKNTIVIPILNIYGTGGKLQKQLPEILVTDGCIYVAAAIKEPGVLEQYGKVLSLVFGVRDQSESRPELEEIRADLESCGIRALLSHHIQRAALEKFSYVSPIGAAGLYYNATAADFMKEGAPRESFKEMIREDRSVGRSDGSSISQGYGDEKSGGVIHTGTGSNNFHAERCYGRQAIGD